MDSAEGFLMKFWLFEVLNLVVFEIFGKHQPRQWLTVNAAWSLEIQGLIENVDDGLDEERSDLKHSGTQLKIRKKVLLAQGCSFGCTAHRISKYFRR